MGILDFLKRKKPLEERTDQQVVCNISPETNEKNRLALEFAKKERERIYGKERRYGKEGEILCDVTPETNKSNIFALKYFNSRSS